MQQSVKFGNLMKWWGKEVDPDRRMKSNLELRHLKLGFERTPQILVSNAIL